MSYFGEAIFDGSGDIVGLTYGKTAYDLSELTDWQRGFVDGLNEARRCLDLERSEHQGFDGANTPIRERLVAEIALEALASLEQRLECDTVEVISGFYDAKKRGHRPCT